MDSPPASALRFRDILLGCLDASYSARDLKKLIEEGRHHLLAYLPTDVLLESPPASSVEDLLAMIDEVYRTTMPVDLYRHGTSVPPLPLDRSAIDTALRHHPVTIIIFPGIFGEFIEAKPFHEVFSQPRSAYRRQWEDALANYAERHSQEEIGDVLLDEQFSLDRLSLDQPGAERVRRRLSDLIEVSSIDDSGGEPLVRVVLFPPELMSLETLGDIEDIAGTLSRRLKKFFAIMGTPEHIVLLGYSMGAIVALDAVAKAYAAQEPWIARARAVVAVGGVIYGSHVADEAIYPRDDQRGSVPHSQVRLLRTLVRTLQETRGLSLLGIRLRWSKGRPRLVREDKSKLTVAIANTKAWFRFAKGWAEILESMVGAGMEIPLPKLLRLGRRVDLQPTLALVARIGFHTFKIFSLRQYSLNIRKFKRLVDATLTGAENLTTAARRRWWQANTLPTAGIRYYAVAATMTDSDESTPSGRLGANATTYDPSSIDYQFLQRGYRDFATASGIYLNDSQVAVGRAQFWPNLAGLLNPAYAQDDLDAAFLGVLGVHHWGLALPIVNRTKNRSKNPFPRSALLKALAAQVVFDIAGES